MPQIQSISFTSLIDFRSTSPHSVRSVTLYIDEMGGVAHTIGSALDNDHKEIHLSTSHIINNKQRARDEIRGVIVHEMVHCYQYNGKGQCPGGLIEGIAGESACHRQKGLLPYSRMKFP